MSDANDYEERFPYGLYSRPAAHVADRAPLDREAFDLWRQVAENGGLVLYTLADGEVVVYAQESR